MSPFVVTVAVAMLGTHVHMALGQTDCTGMGTTWGPGIAPPPSGCEGGTGGTSGGTVTVCVTPPCMASHLGQIAVTTHASAGHAVGTAIYGPFENGFGSQQDGILAQLGCSTGQGYVAGGIDTSTAEQLVGVDCGVALPRAGGDGVISLLDACGHHANHFHEHFGCLWQGRQDATTGHSARVATVDGVDNQHIYGKFEDENAGAFAQVDACGGHFGVTPDSNGAVVYHYHVQDAPPFTLGCIGPAADGGLVTVDACRALDTGCGDGDTTTLTLQAGSVEYDPWCPCYDGAGSNVGNATRPAFDDGYTGAGSITGPWTDANAIRTDNSADYEFDSGGGEVESATSTAVMVIIAGAVGCVAIVLIAAVLWRNKVRASPTEGSSGPALA